MGITCPKDINLNNLIRFSIDRSPGLVLVVLGFVLVYFILSNPGLGAETPLPIYIGIGFAFLVAVAGLMLIFLATRSGGSVEQIANAESSSDLEHAVGQLAKNYDILRKQATYGFLIASTFMIIGLVVILVGSIGKIFGLPVERNDLATFAGVIVEVISGFGLYLFKHTFNQLNSTSDMLNETWRILAAFRRAEKLPEGRRSVVIEKLIFILVAKPDRGETESEAMLPPPDASPE